MATVYCPGIGALVSQLHMAGRFILTEEKE
jgi:hypothetical protein